MRGPTLAVSRRSPPNFRRSALNVATKPLTQRRPSPSYQVWPVQLLAAYRWRSYEMRVAISREHASRYGPYGRRSRRAARDSGPMTLSGDEQHRALAMLANAGPRGCTEAIMAGHFGTELLGRLGASRRPRLNFTNG
jgi:hypothetical protein